MGNLPSAPKTTGQFSGRVGRDIRDNSLVYASVDEAREKEDIYEELGRNPTFDGRLLSYFTRVQYDYKGKYVTALNIYSHFYLGSPFLHISLITTAISFNESLILILNASR